MIQVCLFIYRYLFAYVIRFQPGPLVFPATSPFVEVEGLLGVPGFVTIVAAELPEELLPVPVPAPLTAGPSLTYAGVGSVTAPPPVVPVTPATGPDTTAEPVLPVPLGADVLLSSILPLIPPDTAGVELAL